MVISWPAGTSGMGPPGTLVWFVPLHTPQKLWCAMTTIHTNTHKAPPRYLHLGGGGPLFHKGLAGGGAPPASKQGMDLGDAEQDVGWSNSRQSAYRARCFCPGGGELELVLRALQHSAAPVPQQGGLCQPNQPSKGNRPAAGLCVCMRAHIACICLFLFLCM